MRMLVGMLIALVVGAVVGSHLVVLLSGVVERLSF